jgi:hypothetical protein
MGAPTARQVRDPDKAGPSGRVALARAAAAVAGLLAVIPLDQRVRGAAAPRGIVSYELAGTADRARAILDQWADGSVVGVAKAMMLIDLAYPLIYGLALLTGLRWAATKAGRAPWLRRMSWMAIAAPAADYVENAALIGQLWTDRATTLSAGLAAAAAWVKFALIIACMLSIAALVVLRFARRRAGSPT